MSRWGKSFIFMALLLLFGVFYGIHLTNDGIARINGPVAEQTSVSAAVTNSVAPPVAQAQSGPYLPRSNSIVHVGLDHITEVTRKLAQKMLDVLVYTFEKVTD